MTYEIGHYKSRQQSYIVVVDVGSVADISDAGDVGAVEDTSI